MKELKCKMTNVLRFLYEVLIIGKFVETEVIMNEGRDKCQVVYWVQEFDLS